MHFWNLSIFALIDLVMPNDRVERAAPLPLP